MASIENTTFKIIESITPTINDNIKFLLEENNNYKKKYENLMNEHKMILEFPLVKNIINEMKNEINTLKNKSDKITLEINEKKIVDDDAINIIQKICNINEHEASKLLNKNNNDLIKSIVYYQNNQTNISENDVNPDMNPDIVQCELCDHNVNCNNDNIFILYRETDTNKEELVLCAECFDTNKETFKNENWSSDDFSDDEENALEEEESNKDD